MARVNPSLLAIITEGVLSRFSFGAISFALPLYARHLGLSFAEIGLLVTINTTVALLLKPLSSWAADRFGLKRSFLVAIGLRSMVPMVLAFSGVPWVLYAAKSVHGMSNSLRDPSANALISEHGGEKTIASAFAWYSTAKTVSGSLGGGAAGILLTLTASNFLLVFISAFFVSSLALLVVLRYIQENHQSIETRIAINQTSTSLLPAEEEIQTKKLGFITSLLPFIGLGLMITSAAQMLHGLFPLLAVEYGGMSEADVGVLLIASTLVTLFASPAFGWLSDHVNRKLVLVTRGVANILSSLTYLVMPNLVGISAGKLVDDVGKAAFRPAWGSLMAQASRKDRRHRAQTMGYMSLGEDAGDIIGPILASILWSVWGVPVLLGVRILMAVVTELYSLAVVGLLLKKMESRQSLEKEEPHSINLRLTNPNSVNRQNGFLEEKWLDVRRYRVENALLRELVETQSSHLQVLQGELEAKRRDIQELQMLLQHAKTRGASGSFAVKQDQ
jgi:MFS family permease